MSDLEIRQRDIANEQLQRLADSLAELVAAIKEQASTERTVDLSVERIAGPAVGEPIGYVVIAGPSFVRTNLLPIEKAFEVAETYGRVAAVYDLPTEVQP